MNFFAIIGFIIGIVVLWGGLRSATPNLMMFWDWPSLFIVVGGTFASTVISFQLNRVITLFKVFMLRTFKGKKVDFRGLVREIILAVDSYKKGKSIGEISGGVKDYFFKEALVMIQDGILDKQEILEVLSTRNKNMFANHMDETNKMKSMSKFPPAFGMIGTTIGMIVLLSNLGREDAMKFIGPAMSVCLITTLYGAAIANLSLTPMAENLSEDSKEIFLKNKIIIEGISLLLEKASPVVAAERLNSYLKPSQRLDWKVVLGKA